MQEDPRSTECPAWLNHWAAGSRWEPLLYATDRFARGSHDGRQPERLRTVAQLRHELACSMAHLCQGPLAAVLAYAVTPSLRETLPAEVRSVLQTAAARLQEILPPVADEPEGFDAGRVGAGRDLLLVLLSSTAARPHGFADALRFAAPALRDLQGLEDVALRIGELLEGCASHADGAE